MSPIMKSAMALMVLTAALMLAGGCSDVNGNESFDSTTGQHFGDWISEHGVAFLNDDIETCTSCHGNDFRGGISSVSCFSSSFDGIACHPGGPPGHPAGWNLPDSHGASAKAEPDTSAIQGFLVCEKCHGTNFAGGILGESCFTCHGVPAPHPPAPWRGATTTHTTTNVDNAPVCAQCHTNGSNSSVQPNPPAPAGTPPGCFNSTLCHGANVSPHPAGWAAPGSHGASAKALPDPAAIQGFLVCEDCHGTDFSGGSSSVSCFPCHGVSAPHSPAPWRAPLIGPGTTHTTTNVDNTPVCAQCHTNGTNSSVQPNPPAPAGTPPGCFNSTLCHGANVDCTQCHGNPPSGAVFPNVAGAHGPHDALPNVTGVCDTCHDGAGLTTNRHNNGTADVAILPTYNAKTGTAAYDATNNRCSEVSCHGGLVTPNWATGTIDVNADCTSCHTAGTAPATPEYNSYFSGEHAFHFSFMQSCTTFCHDTTKLRVNHFTTLNTTAMEGPASGTLNDALQYNGVSCNPSAGGLVGCHGQRNWQ